MAWYYTHTYISLKIKWLSVPDHITEFGIRADILCWCHIHSSKHNSPLQSVSNTVQYNLCKMFIPVLKETTIYIYIAYTSKIY
jgi:hypothetical protein